MIISLIFYKATPTHKFTRPHPPVVSPLILVTLDSVNLSLAPVAGPVFVTLQPPPMLSLPTLANHHTSDGVSLILEIPSKDIKNMTETTLILMPMTETTLILVPMTETTHTL